MIKNPIVHIAAATSMFFWGFTYIWSKLVFETYTPLTTITIRLSLSFIALFAYLLITNQFEKIKKEHRKLLLISSIFNPFLYFLGEYYGLDRVSASLSAVIISTIPIFTAFAARRFFNEKLSLLNILGLIVSFGGVLMLIFKEDFSLNASPLGLLFLFLAVFSAVIYSVMVKKLTDHYSPITIIANQNLIGALLFLPLFLTIDFVSFISIIPDTVTILSLFMLAIFGSSVCYVLYAFVIKNLELSKANIYTNLIPIFAGISSYFFLDEKFNSLKIIGMLTVISGIILSQLKFKSKI
ncbi:MAG: DMT family transporter [Chlorobi bacterium]|nr:DMT family transporter [Chlorobiota bacterium]